jgi:hypothetical protein
VLSAVGYQRSVRQDSGHLFGFFRWHDKSWTLTCRSVSVPLSLSRFQVYHGLPVRENAGKMPVSHNSGIGSKPRLGIVICHHEARCGAEGDIGWEFRNLYGVARNRVCGRIGGPI